MFDNLLDTLFSFTGDSSRIDNTTTDDAAAQPSNLDLPALPSSWNPASASNREVPVVDLSCPPPPPAPNPTAARRQQSGMRPRPTKPHRSDDEKRLIGDFRTPADAVAVPDPQSWMTSAHFGQGTMHKKPGSNGSFRPINTIDDVNLGNGRRKQITTYGKEHRGLHPSIGQKRHSGQTAYLSRIEAGISPSSAPNSSPRQDLDESPNGNLRRKRRKTIPVINLDPDDVNELREVSSFPVTHTSIGTSCATPLSTRSSQSHHSIASASAMTIDTRATAPKSEFGSIDSIVKTRARRARKSGPNTTQGTRCFSSVGGGSVSGSVKAHKPNVPFESPGDRPLTARRTPRQAILESFSQGKTTHSPKSREQLSSQFPNMRINESTAEPSAERPRIGTSSTELRKQYVPVASLGQSVEQDSSEDELAVSNGNVNQPTRKRVRSPSTTRQFLKRSLPKRAGDMDQKENGSFVCPLAFARTHGYELDGEKDDLSLRRDANGWRVTVVEPITGNSETKFLIKSHIINKALTDDVSRIRLEGPRQQNSICYIVDLQFSNTSDHSLFRTTHVKDWLITKEPFRRTESEMTLLFGKALSQNDKVALSEPVGMGELHEDVYIASRSGPSKTILSNLSNGKDSSTLKTARNGISKPKQGAQPIHQTTRTSTRVVRPTQAYLLNHDLDEPIDKPVDKFSISVGLGPAWYKPLEYGKGRQRAVIHFDDLPRLDEEECLNDSLIDFYMIYLSNKLHVPSDKVYFFNTYFFTQLTKNTGRESMNYKAVERWTSKIDVFGYDYLVIPINEATHWYLAIICNVSNIVRKPVLENFDIDLTEASEPSRQDMIETSLRDKQIANGPRTLKDFIGTDRGKQSDDEDPNLIDEESNLILVDRDKPEEEIERHAVEESSQPMRSSPFVSSAHAVETKFDGGLISKGILCNAIPSPGSKKNKRKPSQMKDPKQPIILILDSLSQTRSGTVRALKDWLAAEGQTKRGMEATIKEKGYYPKASQIPTQNNWTDCGVYLLGYVDKFFQDPDEFKTRLLTGEMSAEEDWPELKPREMRNNMRKIIFETAEEHKVIRRASKKGSRADTKTKTVPSTVMTQPTVSDVDKPTVPKTTKPHLINPSNVHGSNLAEFEVTSQQLIGSQKLRLASPFHYKPSAAPDSDHAQQIIRTNKASDSSPVKVSSSAQTCTNSDFRTRFRQKSPQVRISTRTQQPAVLSGDINANMHGMAAPEEIVHETRVPHLSGQNNGPKQDQDPSNVISTDLEENFISLAQQQVQNGKMRRVSLEIQNGEGSASQPIPIDSQEMLVEASRTSNHQPLEFPASQKETIERESRVPMPPASPSIEEVSPLVQRSSKRKHGFDDKTFAANGSITWTHPADLTKNGFEPSKSRPRSRPTSSTLRSSQSSLKWPNKETSPTTSIDGMQVDEIPETPEAEA